MIEYWLFMLMFMLGGACGALITVGISLLDQRYNNKCKKKNCEQLEDGYCASCHSEYYGGF